MVVTNLIFYNFFGFMIFGNELDVNILSTCIKVFACAFVLVNKIELPTFHSKHTTEILVAPRRVSLQY